jgi:nucleoside-diphosphate-sugar epimerase
MATSDTLTLVTGGAGYLGRVVIDELLAQGGRVRVLDALVFGQQRIAEDLEARGVELVRGDVRDPQARAAALDGANRVVHLAAIVGDPACARAPEASEQVNVAATLVLTGEAAERGVERFVFASTCSNYGRVRDSDTLITEDGELSPVSLYARQKVEVERRLLAREQRPMAATCLRFATLYGVAPRMRFDLTVNEFTRDLWADRALEVFGEQFWRPYVHVRDAAAAVRRTLEAPQDRVAGRVFNVGASSENYRKQDLVGLIRRHTARGSVTYVHRDEDPRDYRVSFERIARELEFRPRMTVERGVAEILGALDEERFGDAFAAHHRNVA